MRCARPARAAPIGIAPASSAAFPLETQVLAKTLAHWLTTGLPLTVVAPRLALLLHLDRAGYGALELGMVLTTPSLSLIAAVGAAPILGARRSCVLFVAPRAAALHPGPDLWRPGDRGADNRPQSEPAPASGCLYGEPRPLP
jgi:hypothetical protein